MQGEMRTITLGEKSLGITLDDGTTLKVEQPYMVWSPRKGEVILIGTQSKEGDLWHTIRLFKDERGLIPADHCFLQLSPESEPKAFKPMKIPFILHLLDITCTCKRCQEQTPL